MPKTPKGRKILGKMKDYYGERAGERVFQASAKSGKIKGVHRSVKNTRGKLHRKMG